MNVTLRNAELVKAISNELKSMGVNLPIKEINFTAGRKNNGTSAEVILGRTSEMCITDSVAFPDTAEFSDDVVSEEAETEEYLEPHESSENNDPESNTTLFNKDAVA